MTTRVHFLPSEKEHEATRLLPWVMSVMVYLSALSLIGGLVVKQGFNQWAGSLSNRITIQITENDPAKRERITSEVESVLSQMPGILKVNRLDERQIADLLEPWLGVGNVTDDLPVPAMIDVEISQTLTLDMRAIESRLQQISPMIHLDDHQQWLGRFMELMTMIEYTALGILLLVMLATICIVIFGTKAGMAEHRDTIRIMHLMGAHDEMIAGAYQSRFMRYGFKGGLIGLFLALMTIYGLAKLIQDVAQDLVSVPEMPLEEMALLLLIPFIAALITMVTARITVMKELRRMV